ncbi:MAG: hypothetical protein NVSMB52_01320 [Chloroflexota bacterium]
MIRRFPALLIVVLLIATGTLAARATTAAPALPNPRILNIVTAMYQVPEQPLSVRLYKVTAPSGATMRSRLSGMVYGLAGALFIKQSGEGQVRVAAGQAWYARPGIEHSYLAGHHGATILFFTVQHSRAPAPAAFFGPAVRDQLLYRSPSPIRNLSPGPYELTVQHATWSPEAPLNGPHYRTGIGLYYIMQGTFDIEVGGQMRRIPAGGVNYEAKGMAHRNANPSSTPTSAIFFTLTPSGQQVVLQQLPPPAPSNGTLEVYGAGGPAPAIQAALAAFEARTGVKFTLTTGPTGAWLNAAQQNGDIVFFGAEYVMDAFQFGTTYSGERRLPTEGLIIPGTRISPYTRSSGLLVRPGNPLGIRTFRDLTRKGMKILTVQGAGQTGVWEDMAARAGILPEVRAHIAVVAVDGADAIRAWDSRPDLNAWITWDTWHYPLKTQTQIVSVNPAIRDHRGLRVAILRRSEHRRIAGQFLRFLQSPAARAVLHSWGWSSSRGK